MSTFPLTRFPRLFIALLCTGGLLIVDLLGLDYLSHDLGAFPPAHSSGCPGSATHSRAMSVHEPTNEDEFDDFLKTNKVVVVDFYATWCGPCKLMAPKFLKMSAEFPNILFLKVDVDESEDIVSRYDIKVMPTFVFIKANKQIDIVEGNVEDQLRTKLAHHAA